MDITSNRKEATYLAHVYPLALGSAAYVLAAAIFANRTAANVLRIGTVVFV
jgi:hypothetical protein